MGCSFGYFEISRDGELKGRRRRRSRDVASFYFRQFWKGTIGRREGTRTAVSFLAQYA